MLALRVSRFGIGQRRLCTNTRARVLQAVANGFVQLQAAVALRSGVGRAAPYGPPALLGGSAQKSA
eukprot:15452957-Alexandrium_andersonii.AAC.1